jgi:hypothetical protein
MPVPASSAPPDTTTATRPPPTDRSGQSEVTGGTARPDGDAPARPQDGPLDRTRWSRGSKRPEQQGSSLTPRTRVHTPDALGDRSRRRALRIGMDSE